MRLPEKTIELNFCAELTAAWAMHGFHVLWFGPTQKQEAKLGFDAATKLPGGRLYLFQFKASCHVLNSGARRFHAPHRQMQILHAMSGKAKRSVFYVFPTIGTTQELQQRHSVLNNSLLMDVAQFPSPIPATHRARGNHLVDVDAAKLTAHIHSDPFDVSLMPAAELPQFEAGTDVAEPGMPTWALSEFREQLLGHDRTFGWKLQCALVLPNQD